MAAVTGAQRHRIPRISWSFSTQVKYFSTNLITVRAHRGHTWSEATQNPCKFYQLSVKSKNPEIQYFQKNLTKNFKVLIKRFLLGSYDLPGFLDYWIIINLTRLWDQVTGNSPISSCQPYQVSMQPRPSLERSDPNLREKVEMAFYLITAIHQLTPKWDGTKR